VASLGEDTGDRHRFAIEDLQIGSRYMKDRRSNLIRLISESGLPLKIKAEWTSDSYWNRRTNFNDELDEVKVEGWLIRINGKKYPRDNYADDGVDWTYRYTAPNTDKGRQTAIRRALGEARLTVW